MLKRITALFTAIVMIAVLAPASFATEETPNCTVLLFNGGKVNRPDGYTLNANSELDTTTFTDAYPYGSTIKLTSTTSAAAQDAIAFDTALDTASLGANEYLYFGMDIKSSCSGTSDYMSVRLADASKVRFQFQFRPAATGYNYGSDASTVTEVTGVSKIGDNWVNLGFVIQLTDSTGVVSGKVMSVSYDGVAQPMPSSDWIIGLSNGGIPALNRITFYSKKNGTTYADNFEVIRYSAADGVCPVTTRYEMKTSIDTYETQYNGYITDGVAVTELAAVKTAIDEAKALYNSSSLTQEECTAAISKIAELIAPFGSYKTVLSENFNSLIAVPGNITTSTGYSQIAETGDYFFKDAVRFSSETGQSQWPAHKIDFDDISFAAEKTYIEAEFDIKPFNLAQNTRDFTVVLGGADSTRMWALRFFSDGTVYVYNDKDSKTVQQIGKFDIDDWNHIKLVLKTVKTDDVVLCRVDSVFINGEEAPIDDSNKSFFYSDEALSYITFKTNKNEGYSYEFGAYMDNISVRTYTSEDGTSPLSDRYAVIGAAREFYNAKSNIEVSPDKRGFTAEEIAEIGAAIDKLYSYSEYAVLTSSQTAEINAVKAEIYALLEKNAVREIFDEDFEDATNIFNASTQADAGSATENVAVVDSSLSYTLATPVGVTDDLSKLVQWEFDVMVENPATGSVELALQSAGENVEAIEITDSAITMKYNGSFRGASAEKGKWYRIRIVTGEKEGASGNTAFIKEFNINGNDHIIVVENAERNLGSKTQIDSIKLSATNGAKAYIDNVSLKMYYTDTEAPVNKGALIDYIRRGNAALAKAKIGVNILQSIYDTYAVAVSVAKAVYNNEEATQDAVYTATDTLCTAASKYIFKDESVKIGAIEFADASGNAVTAAAKGVYIDKINVTRKADYGDGSIFIAVYDNGVLKQTKILKDVIGSLAVGERIALEVDDMLLGDFTHIKAFAFDSLGKLSPIAMPYSPTNGEAKVYVAGDSIVQSYIDTQTKSYYPRQGWGYYLDDYLSQDITVNNLAVSGYTTVSYISYGKLNTAEETMNEGDYLLVSFMANDNNKMTASQFKNMLRYYNDVAKLHGATAVFITSPKTAYEHQGEFNGFCTAMRDIASELDAALLDVYAERENFEEETSLAYVQSSMYLFNLEENFGMTAEQIQANLGSDVVNGKDKTHLSQWGAERVASWIAELLQNTDSTLRYYKNDKVYVEPDAYTAG